MRLLARVVPPLILAGCCGRDAPVWTEVEPVFLDGVSVEVDLAAYVTDDRVDLVFGASAPPDQVIAEVVGSVLTLTPQPGWRDTTTVQVTVTDRCDNVATTEIVVDGSGEPGVSGGDCAVTLTWSSPNAPDAVAVAGTFNDWDTEATPMTLEEGVWSATLELEPGAYAYKFVELDPGLFEDAQAWTCDPQADYIQCDAGYKEPWDTEWAHVCSPGVTSCNSLLIVEPCDAPRLEVGDLRIDRQAGSIHAEVTPVPGHGGEVAGGVAMLDGDEIPGWVGDRFVVDATGLTPGRHVLTFEATDAAGNVSEPVTVPFWTDDWAWDDAVMYFAFVDRVKNGDVANDGTEGATAVGGAYEGGDFAGLIEMLPYLDDLGVNVVWISNAQDNAEGAWGGDCDQTFAGYHAYWPDDAFGVEEHFGDEDTLKALVDAAHARGMRVVMDWVANHVHQDHPYYVDHPEWFNPQQDCRASVDGQVNFDRIPEVCWFAPYLPDLDYYQPEPLVQMVDDAIVWAREYELDGFRVDAVKHMPHAVSWNLSSAVRRELEHTDAGGDERFYTIGETFDGTERVQAYLGEEQLDGQFDFPLYFALRPAFVYDSVTLPQLLDAYDASRSAFAGSLMSTFLGNHDVLRFVTDAAEGSRDPCDGTNMTTALPPTDPWPYDRMKLAWTFLMTQPGVPLVYYGDELGLPGQGDPDNRQPLAWHADLDGVETVEDFAGRVDPQQAGVLRHVAALIDAREAHRALRYGQWIEWWREDALFAYALSDGGDHALVVLNRSDAYRELPNGLAFAGLPTTGTYEDVLTGDVFTPSGDFLHVTVNGWSSRVLVHRP